MSKRYPGNFITGNPVALSQTSNSGIWDLKDQYQAHTNGTWQEVDGVFEIGRSLRFRSSVGTTLSKTNTVAGNQKIWTMSFWFKRGKIGATASAHGIMGCYAGVNNDSNNFEFRFVQADTLQVVLWNYTATTTAVFRDTSAWYHIVLTLDTTVASGPKIKVYVNGALQQWDSDSISPNLSYGANLIWNSTTTQYLGRWQGSDGGNYFMDGNMTEVNFVDGQALDPSYFGYFDSITNIWQPKRYTGTYGTNGFYLPFSENNSTTNLGRNFAGSNLVTYSEQFDNGAWSVTQGNISANAVAAPNGQSTADYLRGNTTNTFHYITRSVTVASSTRYTWSVYCKKADYNIIQIGDQGTTGAYVYANLTNGELPAVGSNNQSLYNVVATTQFVGDGWYRITCSLTTGSSQTSLSPIIILLDNGGNSSFAGSTTAGTYIWGAQLNLGSNADRYIQTVATAATNDWTLNNFSVTLDSMVDSPVNVFTSATDIGGVVPGNYATLSNLVPQTNSSLTDGNLQWFNQSGVSTSYAKPASFWGPGKWYFEVTVTNGSATSVMDTGAIGVMVYDPGTIYASRSIGYGGADYVWRYDGYKVTSGTLSAYGTAVNSNTDVVMCAYDTSNNTVWFGKNGTWFASSNPATATSPAFTDAVRTDLEYLFKPIVHSTHGGGGTAVNVVNFGQRQFAYTPPAGFKSLCTTNLQERGASTVGTSAITPNKWFDTNLWGGTGQTRNIVNSGGFKPDLVWAKARNQSGYGLQLTDSVRGGGVYFTSNSTGADGFLQEVIGFNNDGFQLGTSGFLNGSGDSDVGWQWKQSPTAGFNIVSYTGDGASSRTITHNLGVRPKFIMTKRRQTGNWFVYHHGVQTYYPGEWLYLNVDYAHQNTANAVDAPYFKTAPTSSVFSIAGDGININGGTYISYVWAEVPGFSKIGAYYGNGSSTDGPFVYTGFKPAFILTKNITTGGYWWEMVDNKRSSLNPTNRTLYANVGDSEYTSSGYNKDLLSNGFKPRGNSAGHNSSGDYFAFVAFAESPFALNNRAE